MVFTQAGTNDRQVVKNLQIYKQLLQFPLFQGMSHDDLQQVAAYTKLDFRKYVAGDTVYNAGDVCRHLYLLINGEVNIISMSDDCQFTVEERMSAPYMAQLERLFGFNSIFSNTMRALTDLNVLLIEKQELNIMSEQYLVFRLNQINLLSYKAQRLWARRWHQQPATLEQRIVRYLVDHCERPAGFKNIKVTMNYLAQELNDSRLDVSRALNRLQQQGLITLHRGGLTVAAMEKLMSH